MQVRDDYTSPTPHLDLDTAAKGGIQLGGVAGTVDIHVPAADTDALSFTTGVYDIEIEDSLGVVTRLVQGAVRLAPSVTR
jgi:hypothetical protein